jgi:ParB family chromosome partitioning protein
MLLAGDLDMGHARALLGLEAGLQVGSAHEIVAKKLSVREAEKLVARAQGPGRQATLLRVKKPKPRDVLRLEEQLADALAAEVEIRLLHGKSDSGELAIRFSSLDELGGLLQKLGVHEG